MAWVTRYSKYICAEMLTDGEYRKVSEGELNAKQFMPAFVRLTLFLFCFVKGC